MVGIKVENISDLEKTCEEMKEGYICTCLENGRVYFKLNGKLHAYDTVDLKRANTCELVDELIKREGVSSIRIKPYDKVITEFNGPVVVLQIED